MSAVYRSIARLVVRTAAGASRKAIDPAGIPGMSGKRRAWFHAASAGELESLWTIIEGWLSSSEREAIVTVFSTSGIAPLEKLGSTSFAGKILTSGLSPIEGSWRNALAVSRPEIFVTAKYEAWPELWMSLAEFGIPLAIVGARPRKSLSLARFILRAFRAGLPRMILLPVTETDAHELRRSFPAAKVEVLGEPRWDRVAARSKSGSVRASELVERWSILDRPWGILGQVWQEDLEAWGHLISQVRSRLFVVPHKIDPVTLAEVEGALVRARMNPVRSSRNEPTKDMTRTSCVLVDEMGILSELYPSVDWAYVGGGFGAGVHSTIEPALHGIPLACGPAGADQFPEIGELRNSRQLQLVRGRDDLLSWLKTAEGISSVQRAEWKADASRRLGASGRILELLLGTC